MTTADDLAGLLLRRGQSVYVPSGAGRSAETAAAVVVLEAELADRGHLLTAPLRRALTELSVADLAATGRKLLADVDALMGSDRHHAPLFRRFPDESRTSTRRTTTPTPSPPTSPPSRTSPA